MQEEYVIANEHEPDKEQSESFSETTHEMFSDVHSGTCMSTETIRFIRDGEKGGGRVGMEVGVATLSPPE